MMPKSEKTSPHPSPDDGGTPLTPSSTTTAVTTTTRRALVAPPTPTHRELVLRVVPMPADVNAAGDIFGGWVMAQVDIGGAVLPMRIAGGRIATVAVNQFVFKQPVKVGDLLSVYAEIVRVGRTSITVEVEVWAQRLRNQDEFVKVTEATLTYVAVDSQGQPRPVPG
jgi:acyl-CoA thioesterase YciA